MSEFDVVIRGGRVADGTGMPAFVADVGVRNGRIAKIGRITTSAAHVIDANGLLVTPGFVDVHTHYDGPPRCTDSATVASCAKGRTRM